MNVFIVMRKIERVVYTGNKMPRSIEPVIAFNSMKPVLKWLHTVSKNCQDALCEVEHCPDNSLMIRTGSALIHYYIVTTLYI